MSNAEKEALKKSAEEAGEEVGEAYSQGVVVGTKTTFPTVEKAIGETADVMTGTMNDKLEIASPSKVGKRQGAFYIEGIVLGIMENEAELAEKTAEIIDYMRRITDGSAEDAGQSLGITVAESMSASMMAGIKRALSSAQSFISRSGIYESASGKGGGVNVTQYFNTPVQSPYQTKVATEQGIKAVLY